MTKEIKELFNKQELEKQELFHSLIEEGKIKYKERANKYETRDAYTKVLETGDKANEALLHVEKLHDKPDGWKDSVKHSPVPKNFIDYSINYHTDHAISKLMRSEGILNKDGKRALKSASTLSSFLNTLSNQVNLTHEVLSLKSAVRELASHAIETNQRLDALEEITEVSKEKALQLIKKGYNNTYISKLTGKHRNTIARWRKELN